MELEQEVEEAASRPGPGPGGDRQGLGGSGPGPGGAAGGGAGPGHPGACPGGRAGADRTSPPSRRWSRPGPGSRRSRPRWSRPGRRRRWRPGRWGWPGAAVELARAELARRSILAPVEGVVLSVGITVGSVLSGFQPVTVVELAPAGPPRVLAEIDELFAHRVRVGQEASIVAPGTGEVVARGSVVFVAPGLSGSRCWMTPGGASRTVESGRSMSGWRRRGAPPRGSCGGEGGGGPMRIGVLSDTHGLLRPEVLPPPGGLGVHPPPGRCGGPHHPGATGGAGAGQGGAGECGQGAWALHPPADHGGLPGEEPTSTSSTSWRIWIWTRGPRG